MKKLLVLLFLGSLLFVSCKKRFPDGPLISFKGINERIEGNWELENYIVDGIDSAEIINNKLGGKCNIIFFPINPEYDDYNNYNLQWGNDTSNYFYLVGDYEINAYKTYVNLTLQPEIYKYHNTLYIALGDYNNFNSFQVLKCEYNILWLLFQIHNKNYELHLNSLGRYY